VRRDLLELARFDLFVEVVHGFGLEGGFEGSCLVDHAA